MDKITSMQGKEFNYSDILSYYRVGKEQIIVLLNDKEQFEKFAVSRRKEDFPTANLPYSAEMVEKVILDMKQIKDYPLNPDGTIRVEYEDGTIINFDKNSRGLIDMIYLQQRNKKERRNVVDANLSEFAKQSGSLVGAKQDEFVNDETISSDGLTGQSKDDIDAYSPRSHKIKKIEKYEELKNKADKKERIAKTCFIVVSALLFFTTARYDELLQIYNNLVIIRSLEFGLFVPSLFSVIESISEKTNLKSKIEDLKEELGIIDEDKKRGGK